MTWTPTSSSARAAGYWPSAAPTVPGPRLVATDQPPVGDSDRRIDLTLDGREQPPLVIPKDQADVLRQLDLSSLLPPGSHRLTITEPDGAASGYQVAFRYHVPAGEPENQVPPLAVNLAYDRTDLAVGDTVTATATVRNGSGRTAPMVILDLPIPPGFEPVADDFAQLVRSGTIAKYQVNPRGVVVYVRGLEANLKTGVQNPFKVQYHLRATLPVKVTVPPARVYEYYDPDRQGFSPPARMTVTARGGP